MVILRVNFEMFREVVDALAQKRDLHFRRSGIAVVRFVLADDPGLAVLGKGHRSSTNGPGTLKSTGPPYSVYLASLSTWRYVWTPLNLGIQRLTILNQYNLRVQKPRRPLRRGQPHE